MVDDSPAHTTGVSVGLRVGAASGSGNASSSATEMNSRIDEDEQPPKMPRAGPSDLNPLH